MLNTKDDNLNISENEKEDIKKGLLKLELLRILKGKIKDKLIDSFEKYHEKQLHLSTPKIVVNEILEQYQKIINKKD